MKITSYFSLLFLLISAIFGCADEINNNHSSPGFETASEIVGLDTTSIHSLPVDSLAKDHLWKDCLLVFSDSLFKNSGILWSDSQKIVLQNFTTLKKYILSKEDASIIDSIELPGYLYYYFNNDSLLITSYGHLSNFRTRININGQIESHDSIIVESVLKYSVFYSKFEPIEANGTFSLYDLKSMNSMLLPFKGIDMLSISDDRFIYCEFIGENFVINEINIKSGKEILLASESSEVKLLFVDRAAGDIYFQSDQYLKRISTNGVEIIFRGDNFYVNEEHIFIINQEMMCIHER